MNEFYVQLQKLTVGYGNTPVISDIEIGIRRGEIVTLIGPNGAGKSTVLKSIARQLSWLGGDVAFKGKSLREYPLKSLSRHMAVMLTDRVHPELMTCRDIVAAGRYPYTGRMGILTAEDRRIVEQALEAVGIRNISGKDFNRISDGQKQRVLLARAIAQQPDILVLDEPTSYLDVRHKLELLSILRKMAREENITVIMSLHEIDLAMKASDRIVCVDGEKISHFGTPEEIFREDIIRELYQIGSGFFDPMFGSVELPAATGLPEVFVISSSGNGIPLYRKLQREGIPFAAGILYENDVDYRLARLLASEVVTEKPFSEISEETLREAADVMGRCKKVINAGAVIGSCNRRLSDLLELALESGKLESRL